MLPENITIQPNISLQTTSATLKCDNCHIIPVVVPQEQSYL